MDDDNDDDDDDDDENIFPIYHSYRPTHLE